MKAITQIFILFLINQFLCAQAVERFHFSLPETLISNSLYHSFEFVDSRPDTLNFGRIYSDHYKRKVPLVASVNMATQLNWLLNAALDSSAANGELLFQLRKFEFVELGEIPDYGYCPIRIDLYVKKNSNYFFLARLDTFIATAKGIGHINVSATLLKQSKETISQFIFNNLQKESVSKRLYTIEHVRHIDSIEKTHLPLFYAKTYVNGIYLSYASFKIQQPDYKLLKVSRKENEIQSLILIDKKGKQLKISYKEVYAFVTADTAYISDYFGCYPLQKINGDFYFKGRGRVLPNNQILSIAKMGGEEKERIGSLNTYAFYNARIDHCDGSVIWFDKVNK